MEHQDYERELKYLLTKGGLTLEEILAKLVKYGYEVTRTPRNREKNETYYDTGKNEMLNRGDVLRHSEFKFTNADGQILTPTAFMYKRQMSNPQEPWVSKMELGSGKYETIEQFLADLPDVKFDTPPQQILTAQMQRYNTEIQKNGEQMHITYDRVRYSKDGKTVTEDMLELEDEHNRKDGHLHEVNDILLNSGLPLKLTKHSKYERGYRNLIKASVAQPLPCRDQPSP